MSALATDLVPDAPGAAQAGAIIRTCIDCGCCNSGCPTFDLLGDELDSPRGRIRLMKDMLENGVPPDAETVLHLDRCLSCNACLTTCPSGVDYMHLIDHARGHIETAYDRPVLDRVLRALLARILPYPERFRLAMIAAWPVRWLAPLVDRLPGLAAYGALMGSTPVRLPSRSDEIVPGAFPATGESRKRVLIPSGCVQSVLDPDINRAAIRLLNTFGVDVVLPDRDTCCGALVLHLGRNDDALDQARRNIDAWSPLIDEGLDAIVITTSGCGTTIKDYGHLLAGDPAYADRARRVSEMARDITEFLVEIDLPKPAVKPGLKVAYHAACSLQHAQKVMNPPRKLLLKAGFKLARPDREHLCCGSAGTYSILQPDLSRQLRDRKVAALEAIGADVIAAGNIGCIRHIGESAQLPVLHTVQLLDWAYGGDRPAALGSS